jgi:hypothetical protein
MLAIFAGAVVVPTAMQIYFLNDAGWVTQGRYMLPGLVGLVLMAAFIVDERAGEVVNSRGFVRLVALLVLPIQLFCLVFSMVRWQRGMPALRGVGIKYLLNPFAGDWHPVVGSVTPLVCMVVGLVALGLVSWRAWLRPAPAGGTDDAVAEAADEPPEAAAGIKTEDEPTDEPTDVSTDEPTLVPVHSGNGSARIPAQRPTPGRPTPWDSSRQS